MEWSKHYEWVLNMVHVGVHVVDKNGMTVFYNQTMADIDGMEREKVIGKTIFHLYPSLTGETSTLNSALKEASKQ
ncbi:PAS domain-containing protein [Anaerobacillus sp. CMMVII]|uniref:PAS domain-containing protein n=1 Tax=Anaerobacillus sp. CMMVII TaxID=2755588 RepID=UPI0021B7EB17|nr:PAS domain-containing protein [Anaerobacillus sp. CMMVII]